jgi:hypothetical protein
MCLACCPRLLVPPYYGGARWELVTQARVRVAVRFTDTCRAGWTSADLVGRRASGLEVQSVAVNAPRAGQLTTGGFSFLVPP